MHSADGQPLAVLRGHHDTVNAVAWRAAEMELYSAGNDGMVLVWAADAANGSRRGCVRTACGAMAAAAAGRNGGGDKDGSSGGGEGGVGGAAGVVPDEDMWSDEEDEGEGEGEGEDGGGDGGQARRRRAGEEDDVRFVPAIMRE